MKKLLFTLLFASSAFASEVRILRFIPVTPDGRLAELCGQIIPRESRVIRAITDYDTGFRAPYAIHTDHMGQFCSVVATRTGKVLVVVDEFELFTSL
jgi:hypothetical protein